MERTTIAQAVKIIESIVPVLNEAYWAAADMASKDNFYDLIGVLQKELNELAKLSVEDHYMAYEPITQHFKNCASKIKQLRAELPNRVNRTETATLLESELPALSQLLMPGL